MPRPRRNSALSEISRAARGPERRISACAQSTKAGWADAVVDEGARRWRSSLAGGGSLASEAAVSGVAQLVEVADQGEREELLLAGEVPVDDGPVDADRAGDVLDLGVADAALVEEGAGGGDDLGLAGPAAGAPPLGGVRRSRAPAGLMRRLYGVCNSELQDLADVGHEQAEGVACRVGQRHQRLPSVAGAVEQRVAPSASARRGAGVSSSTPARRNRGAAASVRRRSARSWAQPIDTPGWRPRALVVVEQHEPVGVVELASGGGSS